MNLHAWLVAATGLPEASVWEAYQNSAQEPPTGTDYVTYDIVGMTTPVFLSEEYELPEDENEPVPEDVTLRKQSIPDYTVTIRVFGNNQLAMAQKVTHAGPNQTAAAALAPAIFQRVSAGTFRIMPGMRELGWTKYVQFDVIIKESVITSEAVPTIQGSEISGTVGDMPMEVVEP